MLIAGTLIRLGATVAAIAVLALPSGGALADDAAGKNLVSFRVVGDAIPAPLTTTPGDPAAGLRVIEDRKLGNCLGCHNMPIKGAADPGNVGPDLHGVGSLLKPGQLRLRLVNMKRVDPTTIMPAYYRVDGLHDVGKAFLDKPILDAQQIEDVVAFLSTFTTSGASK